MKKNLTTRRTFLGRCAAATAAMPMLSPARVFGANDRITMGFIGTGGQGRGDLNGFLGFPEVQVLDVCDVVEEHVNMAKRQVDNRYGNRECKATKDWREVVAREDLDAVFIGTPDHWHAVISIAAMKSGKDVYCEKPETLTIREGREMTQVARRYGRVFSGGSQRVWGDYNWMHKMIYGGRSSPKSGANPDGGR